MEGQPTPVSPKGVLRAPSPCAVIAQVGAAGRAVGRGGKGQRMLWHLGAPEDLSQPNLKSLVDCAAGTDPILLAHGRDSQPAHSGASRDTARGVAGNYEA